MAHPLHKEKHPKQEFQVERLAFFSDAVFAIAITLMVIEFRVPHITKETTFAEAWHEMVEMRYKFFATLFSFLLISIYWLRHHLLFKHIHNYNRPILLCSLLVLLPMIFFPFTTAFYAETVYNMQVFPLAVQFFLINNIVAGIVTYLMFWLVTKRYPDMSYEMTDKDRSVFNYRVLWMTISMTLMLILSFISIELVFYGLIPWLIISAYRKTQKNKKATTAHAK
jgi:uncharacterized membrane protein